MIAADGGVAGQVDGIGFVRVEGGFDRDGFIGVEVEAAIVPGGDWVEIATDIVDDALIEPLFDVFPGFEPDPGAEFF